MSTDVQASAKREIATTSALLSGFEVALITQVTPTNVATATLQFKQLKGWEKELETKEKGITGPLNEALKQVRDLFRPTKVRLASLVTNVRGALDAYNREVQAELAAKAARLEAKVEAGTLSERSADIKLARAQSASAVDVIPTRKRKVVRWDEAKVPDEYWVIDEPRLRADVLGGVKVKGAWIEEEESVVNR